MARPPKALITREKVVSASLAIIDQDGLDAFSLPRLAEEMGVSAPSLYHHFADKNAIMSAIAHYIAGVSVTKPRRPPGPDWPEYLVAFGLNFRQAVLRHRNAAPALLEHLPREVLLKSYEDAAVFLKASGVPVHLHAAILDGVETICIGAVLSEARRGGRRSPRSAFPAFDRAEFPHLAEAVDANDLTVKELFAERIRSFLYGVANSDVRGSTAERFPA
ncbi:TetR family transcriptional regulator [Mycolicibacterium palauense]|uniref:TetR family transcriptional regulator n=1 Tax=Mycolicibacterium palauense TaxID=2034511 RepID=UPI000BFEE980|nr:TetR family transcriptional regulator [Mycolicibacterium palauense]